MSATANDDDAHKEDDGRISETTVEILFLLTLFGIVMWVTASFVFVL